MDNDEKPALQIVSEDADDNQKTQNATNNATNSTTKASQRG